MRLTVLMLAVFLTGAVTNTMAQRNSRVTHSRMGYTQPKVRGNKARIICPVFHVGKYPYHGVGVKAGDPFALTYKFYPNERFSIALDVGKAASGLYRPYFRDRFDGYVRRDSIPGDGSTLSYLSHRVTSDLVGEAKVLFHVGRKNMSQGLQAYAGLGWEWKRSVVRYDYQYFSATNPEWQDPVNSFDRTMVRMGPEVVVGLEYAYFRIPVSAFMEAEYFTDVQDDPSWRHLQGGVGLRYIFKW